MISTALHSGKDRVYGPIDHLLTGIYACLAGYSAGVAVGSTKAAWFFVAWIVAGSLFSFFVQFLFEDQPLVRFDGAMYVLVALSSVLFARDLAKLVPEQAFQGQLVVAGSLCWMLALGSFFTWRDGTLLFQAVPGIALFGMVGVFDTFRLAPTLFFVFLLCLATLFARAHRRQMIELAHLSGYKAMLDEEDEEPTTRGQSARMKAIYNGPWKWMAGPEWAFASAVVIVIISVLGAPRLQFFLKPIAGFVKVQAPPLIAQQNRGPTAGRENAPVRIGAGPQILSNTPVLRASLDQARYLRSRSYSTYNQGEWFNPTSGVVGTSGTELAAERASAPYLVAINEIRNPKRVDFRVDVLRPDIPSVPVPGEIEDPNRLENGNHVQRRLDGTLRKRLGSDSIPPVSGQATVPDSTAKPVNAAASLPSSMANLLDVDGVAARVRQLAFEVSQDKPNDHAKAIAIQREIERRCRYNLQALATPANLDPVEHFLFTSNEGYCDLFASSMTLMARSIGIPARYVTGYYPIRRVVDADGFWVIGESEFHAWAELFFEGVGWVAFDATQGAAEVAGQGRGTSNKTTPWYATAKFRQALDITVIGIVAIGSGIGFWLYRRAKLARPPSREEVGNLYLSFAKAIQRVTGRRRLLSETPSEYLLASEESLGMLKPEASAITDQFVRALYSPDPIELETVANLRSGTQKFAQASKNKRRLAKASS